MIGSRRPSVRDVEALLGGRFNYPEVGATAELSGSTDSDSAVPSHYDIDRYSFLLGRGRDLFERARTGLIAWRQFEIPWLEFHGSGPAASQQAVATIVPLAGLWFVNPCRVVYAHLEAGQDSAAYAYGTLQGHPESGEERFSVSFEPAVQEVRYEITAFSRPARLFSKVGYPLVRRLQRRFAASSAKALAQAAVVGSRL